MVFEKGQSSWNKGKKMVHSGSFKKGHEVSDKIRKKISDSKQGSHHSEETKIKLSGKHNSPNTEFKKGKKTEEFERKRLEKLKEKMIGELNPAWKGGVTPLNKALRMSSFYKIWREAVFLRDNFTCQNPNCEYCHNKMGVMLHSHHIKSFAEYPELRFVINNGITYCAEFHINSKLLHKAIMRENGRTSS